MNRLLFVVFLLPLLFADLAQAIDFELTILHTNDVHSRVMPIDHHDQTCDEEKRAIGTCVGGAARRGTKIREIRQERKNVLLLDAGDQFQGTLFYNQYKGTEASIFMNWLSYDAMTLGNHEFDDGPQILSRFIRKLNFPVISSNIDVSRDAHLKDLTIPWKIIDFAGEPVGIIGFTTEEVPRISSPGPDVIFKPIEESIRLAVEALRSQGVNKIVALSHSGLSRDMQLAAQVDGVDVIISAHSHSFLSNTDDSADGPYPTVIFSPNKEPVLIVTAYAYGKYLGRLDVTFDNEGKAIKWLGEPILLGNSVADDPEMFDKALELEAPISALRQEVVAEAAAELQGACRHVECSVGNIAADAFLDATKAYGTEIALVNGGGIRSNLAQGKITRAHILEALPFPDHLVVVELTGADLWQILEHGVSQAEDPRNEDTGRFLQVSGLRYRWNPFECVSTRIVSVDVKTPAGYQPIDLNKSYTVVTRRFVFDGGNSFSMFKQLGKNVVRLSETVQETLINYVKIERILSMGREYRIVRVKREFESPSTL